MVCHEAAAHEILEARMLCEILEHNVRRHRNSPEDSSRKNAATSSQTQEMLQVFKGHHLDTLQLPRTLLRTRTASCLTFDTCGIFFRWSLHLGTYGFWPRTKISRWVRQSCHCKSPAASDFQNLSETPAPKGQLAQSQKPTVANYGTYLIITNPKTERQNEALTKPAGPLRPPGWRFAKAEIYALSNKLIIQQQKLWMKNLQTDFWF